MKNNRIGRFVVSADLLRDWEQILPLMAGMVVVRCEWMYYNRTVEYIAYSRLFDEIGEGFDPPKYEMIGEQRGDVVVFRAEKVTG